MLKRLKLDDLQVESFSTEIPEGRGTVAAHELTDVCGGTTVSLEAPSRCDCSGGHLCTVDCVEYSNATDWQACCG